MRAVPLRALSPSTLGAAAVAAAASTWGLWGLFIRSSGLDSTQAACIALAAITLLGAPMLPRRIVRSRSLWGALLALGVLEAGNFLTFFAALQRGPVGVAVLAHYLAPMLVAALAPVALGSWPRPLTLAALPFSLLGLALLVGGDLGAATGVLTTAALGAASAVFYALNVLVTKRISDRLAPTEILVYHDVFAALLLVPFALMAPAPSLAGVVWIVGGAAFAGLAAGQVFLWGLARIPAPRASVLTYMEPLVGVLLGIFVLGERPAPWAAAGAALIVAAGAVVILERPALAPVRVHEE